MRVSKAALFCSLLAACLATALVEPAIVEVEFGFAFSEFPE